jgi:phenylacetate-CoA ligase
MIKFLIKNLFNPMWMIYDGKRKGIKYLNYFDYVNKMDRTQLLNSQRSKLQTILDHAYNNTDYYKNLFDMHNFSYRAENFIEHFPRVPTLTKLIVKNHYHDLVARNIPENQRTSASTGGSTGVPMYFLRDTECLYLRRGQELYFDRWMGYEIGQKIAYFVSGSHFDGRLDLLKQKFKNATNTRMISFDPHDITDAYLAQFAGEFIDYHPEIIKCFPNALTPFARFLLRENITVPAVRSISCTGETLYTQQRELFEKVFGGEVYEKVGTRESGVYACECRIHEGLHVFTEGVYLEVIKEDGRSAEPGEMGKLVLTDLLNKAMPLIRYEIGDMVVSAGERHCECGSNLPLIEKYLGRDRDLIIDEKGNPKPGYLFVEVIKNLNLDAQIQVLQPDRKSLIVKVVKNQKEHIDLSELLKEYQKILGPGISITIEFPDQIPRDPSGKFSYVKSAIDSMS